MIRKPEIVATVAEKTALPADKAHQILGIILDEITNAVSRNETVSLPGFGSFVQRHRNARKGKNPQTGAVIDIAASNTVGFKPGKGFKEAVNS